MKTVVAFVGRICLSLIFILSGIGKMMDWHGAEGLFINSLSDLLIYTQEMPRVHDLVQEATLWAPQLLIVATIFELLGGVLLFAGIQVRFAAFLLILFLIPVTYTFHHFWFLEGSDRLLQMSMFLKNLSICGGLLYVLAMGSGSSSTKKKGKKDSEQ